MISLLLYSVIFIVNFTLSPIALLGAEKKEDLSTPKLTDDCHHMLKERGKKIRHQQRIAALLKKNEDLQKRAIKQSPTTAKKLKFNKSSLIREQRLVDIKIENMEEQIIRRGCPGITLKSKSIKRTLRKRSDLIKMNHEK